MDSQIQAPLDPQEIRTLRAGDYVKITGTIYTARDAAHKRMKETLDRGDALPFSLENNVIYYMGPSPAREGRPIGSAGPTTASRMDFAAPTLHRAGVVATVGKGRRNPEVRAACIETGSVYFVACGGAAAYLAKCVASSETVAYGDLGTEALRRIEVVDFPVFVGVDVQGRDVYDLA